MADVKTGWEIELVDDVSPAAKRAESALARLQRRFHAMAAGPLNRAVRATNRFRDGLHRLAANGGVLGMLTRKARDTYSYLSTGAYAASVLMARRLGSSAIGRAFTATLGRMRGGLQAFGNATFGTGWASRLSTSLRSVSSAVTGAAFNLKQRFGPALENAKRKALDFSKAGLALTALAAGAATAKVVATAAAFADFGQKSRKALELMTGSAEAGNKAFEQFRGTAKNMGLGIRSTVEDAQGLLAKGFTVPETDALLKMGADMTAIGAKSEKVKSVFDAMGKIKATGYLQGDELNMLVEAGIASSKIYDALGAKLGKTRQELIKMKEGGKLAASDVLNAVGSAVLSTTGQTEFGAARREVMDSSLSGMWDKTKVAMEDFWLKTGERSGGSFTKAFGKVTGKISEFFEGGGAEEWSKRFADGIEKVMVFVERATPFVEMFISEFVGGFREAWGAIAPALDGFSGKGDGLKVTLGLIAKTLGQVAVFSLAVAAVMGGTLGASIAGVAAVIQGVVGWFDWWVSKVGAAVFAVTNFVEDLGAKWRAGAWEAAKFLIDGLVQGLLGGVIRVKDAVIALAKSALNAFNGPEGIDAHSPSEKFKRSGINSRLGYISGFVANDNAMERAVASVGDESAQAAFSGSGASDAGDMRGGSGGNVIHLHLTVQAPPGGTREQGEKWGRGVGAGLRGTLAGDLEDLALEVGT